MSRLITQVQSSLDNFQCTFTLWSVFWALFTVYNRKIMKRPTYTHQVISHSSAGGRFRQTNRTEKPIKTRSHQHQNPTSAQLLYTPSYFVIICPATLTVVSLLPKPTFTPSIQKNLSLHPSKLPSQNSSSHMVLRDSLLVPKLSQHSLIHFTHKLSIPTLLWDFHHLFTSNYPSMSLLPNFWKTSNQKTSIFSFCFKICNTINTPTPPHLSAISGHLHSLPSLHILVSLFSQDLSLCKTSFYFPQGYSQTFYRQATTFYTTITACYFTASNPHLISLMKRCSLQRQSWKDALFLSLLNLHLHVGFFVLLSLSLLLCIRTLCMS